jgi:hypothetical protein
VRFDVSEIKIDIPKHLREVADPAFWTFAATEWHRLYMPYVPMRTGMLMSQVVITPGQIEHTAPYAHYLYKGEVYGPNYPITEDGVAVGWRSPAGLPKHPTGRRLSFRHDLHPLASREWDQAARPTQEPKLVNAMQAYVDSGRLKLSG